MRRGLASRAATAAAVGVRALASPACSSSSAHASRMLSPPCAPAGVHRLLSTYVDPRDTAEGKRRRRQSNFWRQWGERSQQEFWQDVGFNHDREKDETRSGVKTLRERKGKGKPLELKEGVDDRASFEEDEYWHAIDALDEEGRGAEALGEAADRVADHYWGTSSLGSSAGTERLSRARAALLRDGGLTPSRRAELMTLLEDAGPEGLLPPPPMPREDWLEEKEAGTFKLQEDLSRNLVTTRSYSDGARARAMPACHARALRPDGLAAWPPSCSSALRAVGG